MEEEKKRVEGLKTGEIELESFDPKPFIGIEVKIVDVAVYDGQHGYYVLLSSEPVATLNDKPITASKILGLQKDKEGKWGWGPDTKTGQYLKKMDVKHYDDLKGKDVIVQTRMKDGTEFLTF